MSVSIIDNNSYENHLILVCRYKEYDNNVSCKMWRKGGDSPFKTASKLRKADVFPEMYQGKRRKKSTAAEIGNIVNAPDIVVIMPEIHHVVEGFAQAK